MARGSQASEREMGHVCVLDVCVCKCENVCRCVGVSVSVWGCVYWMGWLGYTVVCVCVSTCIGVCLSISVCTCVLCVCVCVFLLESVEG